VFWIGCVWLAFWFSGCVAMWVYIVYGLELLLTVTGGDWISGE
jgi:hypothetical protein